MTTDARRFYTTVEIAKTNGGWRVHLDARPLVSPAGKGLELPTRRLAEALQAEWSAQGDRVDPRSMPLTRLANVAIDRTPLTRAALVDEAAGYARTDLLCHLEEGDAELKARQDDIWGKVRVRAAAQLGFTLQPVAGVLAHPQPADAVARVRAYTEALDDFRLSGVGYGCGLFGSVILAAALERRWLSGEEAHAAASLDEVYQAERWGADEEAVARRALARKSAQALDLWFDTLSET
ncbi:ATPase [bacterium]|nr:ATPase [bacterium]